MKIIEGLKKIKQLDRKIEKNNERIKKWCSFLQHPGDAPATYDADDIRKMMQQSADWAAEKARIRHALHRTNIETSVEFDGKIYSIDEMLCLQNITLPQKLNQLKLLRREEKGGSWRAKDDKDAKVIMQYDPKERDQAIADIEDALVRLDETLDSVNMNTDLVE